MHKFRYERTELKYNEEIHCAYISETSRRLTVYRATQNWAMKFLSVKPKHKKLSNILFYIEIEYRNNPSALSNDRSSI